jgi:hypothetical protein
VDVAVAVDVSVDVGVALGDGLAVGVAASQFTGHRTQISVAVWPARASVMLAVAANFPVAGS